MTHAVTQMLPSARTPDPVARERSAARQEPGSRAPLVLVGLYLCLEFGRPQDLIPGVEALHLPGLVTALLAVSLVGTSSASWNTTQTKLFVALLALMACHVPIARNNYWALMILVTMTQTFLSYVALTTFVNSFDRVQRLVSLWLAIHVYLAIVGISRQGRGVGGFLEDENDFAMTLNMAVPFAFSRTLSATGTARRLLYAGILGLFVYANVSTLSRGGFVGLAAVGVYCWWKSPRKILSAILIAVLVLAIRESAPDKYWDEVRSIQNGTSDPTGRGRTYMWEIGWTMFLDNPVLGVGQGNFPYRFRQYELAQGFVEGLDGASRAGRAAHSLYFTLLAELGAVGTILWAGMISGFWRALTVPRPRLQGVVPPRSLTGRGPPPLPESARERYYLALAMKASLVGYLVSGTFISVLYYPNFWILAGFGVAMSKTAARERAAAALAPLSTGSLPREVSKSDEHSVAVAQRSLSSGRWRVAAELQPAQESRRRPSGPSAGVQSKGPVAG